mmetsp:Transcript_19793/g.35935  ORF Transcript_19793/g.35935 Transcript_19793/m.35935 type:complete len:90 (-) Transcript_19793:1942-2211(-)
MAGKMKICKGEGPEELLRTTNLSLIGFGCFAFFLLVIHYHACFTSYSSNCAGAKTKIHKSKCQRHKQRGFRRVRLYHNASPSDRRRKPR